MKYITLLGERLRSRTFLHAIIILCVLVVNMVFGLPRLGTYSAVDEPYWTYDRTPDFWHALLATKWKSTNINDKPGITVAWLSGIGLLTIDPLPYAPLRDEPKTDEQLATIKKINVAFRLPIYLFTLFALPLFYILTRKALGATTAIFSTIFIGLSPILLGMSLIINPDSLLWIFVPLALLARLAFGRTRERKYLILSGILTGLSLLTKYVANILFVFFFVLPFLEFVFSDKRQDAAKFLKQTLVDFLVLVSLSVITFAALFPATWVKPEMILKGTLLSAAFKSTWPMFAGALMCLAGDAFLLKGRITSSILSVIFRWRRALVSIFLAIFSAITVFVMTNVWLGMKWFNFETFVMSPKNSEDTATLMKSIGSILADFYCLVFGMHPLILALFIIAIIITVFRPTRNSRETLTVVSFLLFVLLYYVGSTANYVIATVRYQIALYPLAFIIAAIGMTMLIDRMGIRHEKPLARNFIFPLFCGGLLAVSLAIIRPHYLTYSSILLPERHILNYKDMGDGSYEAAMYLNALPHARDIRVWSDKGAVCALFIGDCSVSFDQKRFKASVPDYIVLSTGRKRKTTNMWSSDSIPLDFKAAYETASPEFFLPLDNRSENFVKVIRADTVRRERPMEPQ